jgi:molybdopterin-containing oxidoreductase family iron-sulfur binding subunit
MSSMNNQHGFWRSLAEYHDTGDAAGGAEFEEPLDPPTNDDRRRFLQLMSASIALAGTSGCHWKEDKLLPGAQQAEGVMPGVPRYFMTAMELGGVAVGLKVKSFDGRPIKVDGNPQHPDSLGGSNRQHQASVLELYDPDRSSGVARLAQGTLTPATEIDFRMFAKEHFTALGAQKGRGLRVVSGSTSSTSVADMKARFLARFPEARWYEYEPVSQGNVARGAVLAFGAPVRTHLKLENARIIVSLDADLLGGNGNSLALARAWATGRQPETGSMNRLYVLEPTMSESGAAADHRFSLRAEHIKAVAAQLDAELSERLGQSGALAGEPQPRPAAKCLADAALRKFLQVMIGDLAANVGASVVAVGPTQPPEVHALVHRINALLGARGKTLTYSAAPPVPALSDYESISALAQEMDAGAVDTLLVLDTNPVYTAPADVDFATRLAKVRTKIVLSLYRDETAELCDWHVPLAHFLESWGDGRASDGSVTLQQPLIAPLYGGRSVIELLALLTRDSEQTGLGIVKRALSAEVSDPRLWRKAVHDGVLPLTPEDVHVTLKPIATLTFSPGELSGIDVDNGELELLLAPDSKVYDGRFANSGWLQEVPEGVTKLTWDNALLVGPRAAKNLGVDSGSRVVLSIDGRSLDVPVLVAPGQAPGSMKLQLGYGRSAAGRVGGRVKGPDPVAPVGANAYALRSKNVWDFARGAKIEATGDKYQLATTQDKHNIDQIGRRGTEQRLPALVRQATLEEYKEQPNFAAHAVHHPPLLSLWQEPVKYDAHKWGMSIDLNKCTGCNGCVLACVAENNIPVVGKERIAMGREMHWLRIDRYFRGDPEQPETLSQPVPCMQCEHAPCEQVCPVGATVHNREGLNDMTYNRCIGTRYCSNNCPYKVRRFNYFNFHEDLKDEKNQVQQMVYNPDVTVRFRGVMEKCTYCVQRIQEGKHRADRERRPLNDKDITTACQDSCPTQAIVFGDMNQDSEVSRRKKDSRDYAMLEELNVRPRTTYMARVKNPNPELG